MQDCQVDEAACADWAKDMESASKLWELSNAIVGETF